MKSLLFDGRILKKYITKFNYFKNLNKLKVKN